MEIRKRKLRFQIIFVIDILALLFAQVVQAVAMNYYFIKQYEEYFTIYFLFALDFLCLCLFAGTALVAYNYFTRRQHRPIHIANVKRNFADSMEKRFPKTRFGVLPLLYVSWTVYASLLIGKLAVIFGTDVVAALLQDNKYSAQILEVSVALASVVFLLLVESHNWHKKSSDCYSYMTSVCKKTGIEIFDSVEMVDLLITTDYLSRSMENVVFVLASANFLLPVISLYSLNLSNFGKSDTPNCLPLKIMHSVLKVVLIDIPFFVLRLIVWIQHKDMSILMMKNLFYIVLEIREMYLDLFMYFKPIPPKMKEVEEIALNEKEQRTVGVQRNNTHIWSHGANPLKSDSSDVAVLSDTIIKHVLRRGMSIDDAVQSTQDRNI